MSSLKRWELARTSVYFWWWIRLGGTLAKIEVPEGIHLEFLPSGSPELQPAERLWPLTNEGVANRLFEELEEIEEALLEHCVELLNQTQTIRALTNYHWWPQSADLPSTLQPDSV
jgi:transposase